MELPQYIVVAPIDIKTPTYHSVAFFVISRKGGCNFLFFLLNFGQLNETRTADRFSFSQRWPACVLKEFESRLCGSVSAPVRPAQSACRNETQVSEICLRVKHKEGGFLYESEKARCSADGPCDSCGPSFDDRSEERRVGKECRL